MQYREISATLLTPCCISEQPAMGNEIQTLSYIPGTVLRGMLASEYLGRTNGNADSKFKAIFCDDIVRFPNLYPRELGARPLPLSAYTCKRHPGFESDSEDWYIEETHGVFDMLAYEDRTCLKCSHPLQPLDREYYGERISQFKSIGIETMLVTRTAVNPASQSAEEGMLFTQSELPANQTFIGYLVGLEDDAVDDLESVLNSASSRLTAFTGRRRAGRVDLQIGSYSPADDAKPQFLGKSDDGWRRIALKLESDAILIDRLLRPVSTLTPDSLIDSMGFPSGVEAKIEKGFRYLRKVSGWNSVGKIFKTDDIAMVKGSTFLIALNLDGSDKESAALDWMRKARTHGVGVRRSEGFGQVTFSEPLHTQAFEKANDSEGKAVPL